MQPQAFLANCFIKNLQDKWHRVNIVFLHTSRRTEVARYASTHFSGLRFGTSYESGIRNQGSTVFRLTSQKTEIAISACEPKLQGLLAEDALVNKHVELKSLVTSNQQIKKFSVKIVNLETNTGMQIWYKSWLLKGCNHILATPNLLRKYKIIYESFSSQQASRKSFF